MMYCCSVLSIWINTLDHLVDKHPRHLSHHHYPPNPGTARNKKKENIETTNNLIRWRILLGTRNWNRTLGDRSGNPQQNQQKITNRHQSRRKMIRQRWKRLQQDWRLAQLRRVLRLARGGRLGALIRWLFRRFW